MRCKRCGRKKLKKSLKAGIVLVGGSLKGIYGHTGVMSAVTELKSHGIKPSVILGASAGSVIASFYASGMSRYEIYKRMLTLKANDFVDLLPKFELFYQLVINKGRHLKGFVKGDALENYIARSLQGHNNFDSMKIPLYVSSVCLDTYELILFNKGSISDKVRASTSIPILFCPKKIDESNYIDGAIRRVELPHKLLELEPDLDLLIISNFTHDPTAAEKEYLENTRMPMLEITRRVLSMQETTHWGRRIGKTKIINVHPSSLRAVDFFEPNREAAREVFEQSKQSASATICKELKLL